MYGYKEYSNNLLTKDEILEYVSQEEIFQMVLGFLPKEYVYIKSPFRDDRKPRCYFEKYKGVLYFKDWGTTSKHKDCFNAVQVKLNLSFAESLNHIIKHFNIQGAYKKPNLIKINPLKKNKPVKAESSEITFNVRHFNNKTDKVFWSKYGITKENLIEDNIFPITWFRLFSKRLQKYVVIRPITRSYLIYNNNKRIKIYTPDSYKGKFITNCTEDNIGGYDNLNDYGEKLIITKSYKDYRVLKNQGIINCVWFQNEGMFPNDKILKSLADRFDETIIIFDNDSTGIRASGELLRLINKLSLNKAKGIYLPTFLLEHGIKDPSDLACKKGEEVLKGFLIKNNIMTNTPF